MKQHKYVSYKDIKALMADLKEVYRANTEQQASDNLEYFKEKWSGKYPKIYESWKKNWGNLSTYFAYLYGDNKNYLYNKSDREF